MYDVVILSRHSVTHGTESAGLVLHLWLKRAESRVCFQKRLIGCQSVLLVYIFLDLFEHMLERLIFLLEEPERVVRDGNCQKQSTEISKLGSTLMNIVHKQKPVVSRADRSRG